MKCKNIYKSQVIVKYNGKPLQNNNINVIVEVKDENSILLFLTLTSLLCILRTTIIMQKHHNYKGFGQIQRGEYLIQI